MFVISRELDMRRPPQDLGAGQEFPDCRARCPGEYAVFTQPEWTLRFASQVAAIALAALATACDPLAAFEPEIGSAADRFEVRATVVTGVTGTVVYDWMNEGSFATVEHFTTTTSGGAASIRIVDAAGTLVYSKALMPSLTQASTPGAPGQWRITVTMTGYRGTLGFRIYRSFTDPR
jgi:hypothetical protein